MTRRKLIKEPLPPSPTPPYLSRVGPAENKYTHHTPSASFYLSILLSTPQQRAHERNTRRDEKDCPSSHATRSDKGIEFSTATTHPPTTKPHASRLFRNHTHVEGGEQEAAEETTDRPTVRPAKDFVRIVFFLPSLRERERMDVAHMRANERARTMAWHIHSTWGQTDGPTQMD